MIWPTSTWAPWRSAFATCCARRCAWSAISTSADLPSETKTTGVLYLDSREKGSLLSANTRSALDTLASEAGVAIENARLYRQTLEQARIEHELRSRRKFSARSCRQAGMSGAFYEAMGTSLPSRSIGGDFFDFTDRPDGSFGFAVGDVSGKGPAAALLTAKIQGLFSAQLDEASPAQTMRIVNRGLTRRAVEAKYATVFHATLSPTGVLTYCNAGHNPPFMFGAGGSAPTRIRQHAGRVLRACARMRIKPSNCSPGDVLIVYSDGVTEALDVDGQEFGEERLIAILEQRHTDEASAILERHRRRGARRSPGGAAQHDDVTAMVVKFKG